MLTATEVRKAKAGTKRRRLYDTRGLYLEVTPKGGKWWRLKYRFDGKEKLLSLGTYPATSLAEAREKRDAARKLLADGVNPSDARKAAKAKHAKAATRQANTFEVVAHEWQARQDVAERTAEKNAWLLDTFLLPALGHLPMADITPRVLLDALRAIEATGKLETASRAKIKVGQIFRYAVLEGKADADVTASLRGALKAPKHKHHSAITEPAAIGGLMRAMHGYAGEPATRAALLLSALTFVRPGELRRAEWAEFDFDDSMWRIPGEKMKMGAAHLVPLSTQAVDVLRDVQPLTGAGRYVFPSVRTASRPMSENTVNAALRRLGYTTDDMTAHGFRSMAATRLNEMGYRADAIERQLAHAESDKVRDAYTSAAEYLDERKAMMQQWADYLEGLRAGGDVVPFKRKAAGAA